MNNTGSRATKPRSVILVSSSDAQLRLRSRLLKMKSSLFPFVFLRWAELLAKLAAVAGAYYVAGTLGLLLAIPPGICHGGVASIRHCSSWYSTVWISGLAGHFARVVFN
jgi:hypothetical protein